MVRHHQDGVSWWCLPGGGIEAGETPAEAALRELMEECAVDGEIVRETGRFYDDTGDASHTYLVDIGDQEPTLGTDPEFGEDDRYLVEVCWMHLRDIPERDRCFLFQAGLMGIDRYLREVESWGDVTSYPGEPG